MSSGWCRGRLMPGRKRGKMAEIINLRQARKAKARTEKERNAETNRVVHGTPKKLRALEKSRTELAAKRLENRRLDDDIKDK